MDRPENGYLIAPRIDKLEGGITTVLIRRLSFVNGKVMAKDVLSSNGEWVEVPEGADYPKECFLESAIFDRRVIDQRVYNWPRYANT